METMQKRLGRLAFDIDGVLSNFQPVFLNFHNQRYGTRFTIDELTSYEFWKVFHVPEKELQGEMVDFYQSPFFKKIVPLPGSKEAIKQLYRRNLLYVVTSRPDTIHDETVAWLGNHFPNIFSRVHFTSHFGGNGSREKKSDFCLEQGYPIIIEDVAEYANECAERGITAFILTRPWNREEKLHPGVTRIGDLNKAGDWKEHWKELLHYLE
ncbi:MAG: hypothetical protein U1B79_00580 [Candidatus Pacearchaeota archaeon]|nr:hypothetical protein [Nanoarchaeota archaeon]MDZ4226589.1 hypothetical protein [Candidatus Pacearchaeota archaeon]